MVNLNSLIVDALYRSHLDRVPGDAERTHWINVIEAQGAAIVAQHIVSSGEANEVRQRQAQRIRRASLEAREENLAQADQYFRNLAREIAAMPTPVAVTARGAWGLSVVQRDRLRTADTICLLDDPASPEAAIRICGADEIDAVPTPKTALVAVLGPVSPERNLAELRHRINAAEQIRRQTVALRVPAGLSLGGPVDLREPNRRSTTAPHPALLFEVPTAGAAGCAAWAAAILAQANLHHYLSGDAVRCLEALDAWDLTMGTDLARRYQAFAELLG